MKHLFSADNAAKIKDTKIPEYHPGLQANLGFDKLRPQLSPATREYLIPYIGRNFHDVLVAQSELAEPVNDAMAEAIDLARRALAYYVVYETIPLMQGNLSNLGFQVMNDREGTSRSPSQWQYYTAIRGTILKADKYLDQLLVHLDANRDDPEFADYDTDMAIAYRRSRTFRQVAQLDEYWNIQGSRRAWNTVTPYLNKAERNELKPILGKDLFNRLGTLADNGARTPVQGELLERCRDYIAEVGLLAALPHLSCVIGGEQVVVISRTDGFETKNASGLIYSQAAIGRLQLDAETRAAGARRDLQKFLIDNAAEFPDYTAPTTDKSDGFHDTGGAVMF